MVLLCCIIKSVLYHQLYLLIEMQPKVVYSCRLPPSGSPLFHGNYLVRSRVKLSLFPGKVPADSLINFTKLELCLVNFIDTLNTPDRRREG